ncbi:Hypothetical protein A7982_00494 [Minicystis rosea]|nr:Hypothetical protein A7982_00494 [Minicystis rosea]
MTSNDTFSALVSSHDTAIEAHIVDRRPQTLEVFGPLDDAARAALATDAWQVGLRALQSAYRQAEEARLTDVGKALIEDLGRRLEDHAAVQEKAFVSLLTRYFDPHDGQVVTRLERFLQDDGELAQSMNRYLAPDHGLLAETLARQVGENSPLLRRLSPTDSQGVVAMLGEKLREALDASRADVTRALDPASEDGAVARFLRVLKREMQAAENDRQKQIAAATKALDVADPSSPLSVLMRQVQESRSVLLRAVNPDVNGSPMATIKASLTTLLEQHFKQQQEALTAFQKRQLELDQQIHEALARLDERRRGIAKAPTGGVAFEHAVLRFVQESLNGAPVIAETTRATVGKRPNCKVGDQVVRFTAESLYAGAAFVVEAKRDTSYTTAKALAELEVARGNRDAVCGVFVMAQSHAQPGFPRFARHGVDILLTWDEEDEGSDAYLHAAVLLATALTARARGPENAGSRDALRDVEQRICKELDRHTKMRKMIESIEKNAHDLSEELRRGTDKLEGLLRSAKSTLKALDVELAEEEAEGAPPVIFPQAQRTRPALRGKAPALPEATPASE